MNRYWLARGDEPGHTQRPLVQPLAAVFEALTQYGIQDSHALGSFSSFRETFVELLGSPTTPEVRQLGIVTSGTSSRPSTGSKRRSSPR